MYFIYLSFVLFLISGFSVSAENSNYIERVSQNASSVPKVHYGQIFIEETRKSVSFPFEISIFGGQEVGSPYISSSFFGVEMKHRIHSLLYLGFEYSMYYSKSNSAIEALEKKMDLYGLDISYPFLNSMAYINWHYRLFKSHLNVAGFFKMYMDFPMQFGLGLMNLEKKGLLLSIKWGTGPLIYLSPKLGIQLLLSQSVSIKKFQFLYTWCSLNFIYNL